MSSKNADRDSARPDKTHSASTDRPGPKPTSLSPRSSRRRKGERLTLLERYEIVNLKRLHPDWSLRTLGETVGCRADTVRLVLLASSRDITEIMSAAGSSVLDDWRTASSLAAVRGDHRPAKDWLMHSGLIDPLPDGGRSAGPAVVIINAPLPGMPGAITVEGPRVEKAALAEGPGDDPDRSR